MRVLHITRDFPPASSGGLSSAVAGWAQACAAMRTPPAPLPAGVPTPGAAGRATGPGIGVCVVSFDAYRPRGRGSAGVQVEREGSVVPVLRVRSGDAMEEIRAFAAQQCPDLVHLHHGMLLDAALAIRADLGVPLIKSVHLVQAHLAGLRGLTVHTQSHTAQLRAVREADGVTAPSPWACRAIKESAPDLADVRVEVLPLAVSMPARPSPVAVVAGVDTGAVAAGPGLDQAAPRLLYVGRFADVKGTSQWLEAVAEIGRRHPQVQFAIAGGMPASPRGERRFLRDRRPSLDAALPGRIEWLGWLGPDALATQYRRASWLVAPSWTETFGQSVFEALACGTPVIASDVGAFSDYLQDGREALLVPSTEPEAWVVAVERALRDPGLREQLAAGAHRSAARFAPSVVGRALQTLYARHIRHARHARQARHAREPG